jgi:hypothetical protein
MNNFVIVVSGVFEVVALAVIARLWTRPRMGIFARVFWSVVLLIPLFGLLMYGFIMVDSVGNQDKMDSQPDSDAFHDHGDGGGHL